MVLRVFLFLFFCPDGKELFLNFFLFFFLKQKSKKTVNVFHFFLFVFKGMELDTKILRVLVSSLYSIKIL